MITTWVLIVFAVTWDGTAFTAVPGFYSPEACEKAAVQWRATTGPRNVQVKALCHKQ